jgi:Ca2+-binding RTX toxin-like protein
MGVYSIGTARADTLVGGNGDDVLFGRDGNDLLIGGNGDDVIWGENGNDVVRGNSGDDELHGGAGNDDLWGGSGDDWVGGGAGSDVLKGDSGLDALFGGMGNDQVFGGSGSDTVDGGVGNDLLANDAGRSAAAINDLGNDSLVGGQGNDRLQVGNGIETAVGGGGADSFEFKFSSPRALTDAGTIGAGFTNLVDFAPGPAGDRFVFDAAGLGSDAPGASFVDNSSAGAGTRVDSFFRGAAGDANGESVVVVTDQSFALGSQVPLAIDGEQAGDLIIYFNTTFNVGSLLYVSAPDTAASIARFTNVDTLQELAGLNFVADDFVFA